MQWLHLLTGSRRVDRAPGHAGLSPPPTPPETRAFCDQKAAAPAFIFNSEKSICGCRYKPPAPVETPAICDQKAAVPASVFKSGKSVCGCLLMLSAHGRHPQCRTKSGRAGADRKDFNEERSTLALTPAIRRVWKLIPLLMIRLPARSLALTPAIRRVWKQDVC